MKMPNWTPEQVRQFRAGLLFGIVLGLALVIIVLHSLHIS